MLNVLQWGCCWPHVPVRKLELLPGHLEWGNQAARVCLTWLFRTLLQAPWAPSPSAGPRDVPTPQPACPHSASPQLCHRAEHVCRGAWLDAQAVSPPGVHVTRRPGWEHPSGAVLSPPGHTAQHLRLPSSPAHSPLGPRSHCALTAVSSGPIIALGDGRCSVNILKRMSASTVRVR